MLKIAMLTVAALTLVACSTPQTKETVQTKVINGQTAYLVNAGGSIPDLNGSAPTPDDVHRGMKKIETGDHISGLPNQAASICPGGYTVRERSEPRVRPEGYSVWSISATFSIVCKS